MFCISSSCCKARVGKLPYLVKGLDDPKSILFPLNVCIPLSFSLYLRHGFCSESEDVKGIRVKDGNLFQLSTKLGLDPVSSRAHPKLIGYTMSCKFGCCYPKSSYRIMDPISSGPLKISLKNLCCSYGTTLNHSIYYKSQFKHICDFLVK